MSSLSTSVLVRLVMLQYSSKSFASFPSNLKSMRQSSLGFTIKLYVFLPYNNDMTYKAYRTKLTIADRFYPSSQICSECGHRQKMALNQRTYQCGNCGAVKDRDFNASLNLERYPQSVGLTDNTCGGGAADSPRRSKK